MRLKLNIFIKTIIYLQIFMLAFGSISVQQTYAGAGVGGTVIVGDTSPTGVKTALETTLGTVFESIQTNLQTALHIKEFQLDAIAFGLAKTVVKSMVRSIVNWINSGFQGSPAFVTDLKAHLLNIADQVVGDAIYGSDLAFLCSPFSLDVKIALATQYNNTREEMDSPQCTLNDVSNNIEGFLNGAFSEGGWAAWFELTQGETNDPNKAYFSAQASINARILTAQGEEITLLEFGNGFLPFKICSDVQAQSGAETNCTITTPGIVIAEQLNAALGLPGQALIEADEINEIIGALLSQLAQQAITGAYGLLGMGGNSSYTDYSYGASSTSSYLDALEEEPVVQPGPFSSVEAITIAVDAEERYLDFQSEISERIGALRGTYNQNLASTCLSLEFPKKLIDKKEQADISITNTEVLISVLNEINDRYINSTDLEERQNIINEYLSLRQNGLLMSETTIVQTELEIEYEIIPDIQNFTDQMDKQISRCSGS